MIRGWVRLGSGGDCHSIVGNWYASAVRPYSSFASDICILSSYERGERSSNESKYGDSSHDLPHRGSFL